MIDWHLLLPSSSCMQTVFTCVCVGGGVLLTFSLPSHPNFWITGKMGAKQCLHKRNSRETTNPNSLWYSGFYATIYVPYDHRQCPVSDVTCGRWRGVRLDAACTGRTVSTRRRAWRRDRRGRSRGRQSEACSSRAHCRCTAHPTRSSDQPPSRTTHCDMEDAPLATGHNG